MSLGNATVSPDAGVSPAGSSPMGGVQLGDILKDSHIFPDQPPKPCVDCEKVAGKSDIGQFNAACRAAGGLTPGQQRILHGMLSDYKGANGLVPYPTLVDLACEVKAGYPNK
jgi:hypothetical protein